MAFSASAGVIPATLTSLINGTVIMPSGRTTAAGTEASRSPQTLICTISPSPIRYSLGTPRFIGFTGTPGVVLGTADAAATGADEDSVEGVFGFAGGTAVLVLVADRGASDFAARALPASVSPAGTDEFGASGLASPTSTVFFAGLKTSPMALFTDSRSHPAWMA